MSNRYLLLEPDSWFTVQFTNPWSGETTKEDFQDPDVAQQHAHRHRSDGWTGVYVTPTGIRREYKTLAGMDSGERALARKLAGGTPARASATHYTHDDMGNVVTVTRTWRVQDGSGQDVTTRTFGESL